MTSDSETPLAPPDVPQANRVERVLALTLAIVQGKAATPASLGLHKRDLRYYAHAAFVLGLLDREGRPTPLGATFAEMRAEGHMPRLARAFAESRVGARWLAWAGARHLGELDPDSAEAFLSECDSLADSTARRRATALQAWQRSLANHLPESQRQPSAKPPPPSTRPRQETLDLPATPLRIPGLSERGQRHFQDLVRDADAAELEQLRVQVGQHLASFQKAARTNELLPVDIAHALASALERLLDRVVNLEATERALAAGAARYFISDDDASPDLKGVLGLDDDVTVYNAVVRHLGQPDLILEL